MESIAWNEWNPGWQDGQKLDHVLKTLPGADPQQIGFMVRLFENPKSPLALTGAVSLRRHDCIHILLGRGLLPQDEAFVIGFTMGSAKGDLSPAEVFIFKKVARYLYPTPYRLTEKNLVAYELGLEAGKACPGFKVYRYPLEEWGAMTVGEIREKVGVDAEALRAIYQREQALLPDTKASKRLPV